MPTDFEQDYFTNNFNTKLPPEEESKFQTWATANNRNRDLESYDMRGWWKNNGTQAENGHFTDAYKKPNHPTFSDESIYHGTPTGEGMQTWQGGKWGKDEGGGYSTFSPSAEMLKTTHPVEKLDSYLTQHEPGIKLQLTPEEDYNLAYKKAVAQVSGANAY